MKKILILFLITLFIMPVILADTSQELEFTRKAEDSLNDVRTQSIANFRVQTIRQDPFPANPGEFVDIYFNVDNFGGTITTPRFDLLLPYPLSLEPVQQNVELATISPGEKITLAYRIKIDSQGLPGDYESEFRAYSETGSYYPFFLNIKVDNVLADFDVAIQEVNKEGVSIAIANIGKHPANSITINLEDQEDFELLSYPSYIIGNLNNGDYTILNTAFIPNKEEQNLKFKVKIDYTDIIGNRRTTTKEIPVILTHQVKDGFEDLESLVFNGVDPDLEKGNSSFGIIVIFILIVAIVSLIVYFRRKLKNKN